MSPFAARDEDTHRPGTHPFWNESFYLNFSSSEPAWGGAARIGFSPNLGFSDGLICLFLPDGTAGFVRTWEKIGSHNALTSSGGLEIFYEKPFEKWRVRYKGPVFHFENPDDLGEFNKTWLVDLPRRDLSLDLEFNAIHEVFDFHESIKKRLLPAREIIRKFRPGYLAHHFGPAFRKMRLLPVMSGASHYEHAGRITGTLGLDGKVFDIHGFGQRDHSWGVRDMRAPSNWRWFSGQFGDRLCFNAVQVEILFFRVAGGYVYHGGRPDPVDEFRLSTQYDPKGLYGVKTGLELLLRSGKSYKIKGRAETNLPVIVQTLGSVGVVNETRAEFRVDNLTCRGISEFMGQLA